MKVLTEGHKYSLQNFESKEETQTIQFIEKKQVVKDILVTVNDGTTNEEVIEMLIDRLNYLQIDQILKYLKSNDT